MSGQPIVKGWCPGAHRPMMSGDGLVFRVRPRMGRLDRNQALALAFLAKSFGNGVIDLTSRGNLQLRGVDEANRQSLLDALIEAELLDATEEAETKRNILVTPFWREGGLTRRLHDRILCGLHQLPDLPAKMGIVLDTAGAPVLAQSSGDFRFERGIDSPLILRADGAASGVAISEGDAVSALLEMARWFVGSGGGTAGRMHRHLSSVEVPQQFLGHAPMPAGETPKPGQHSAGYMLGAAFGAMKADSLSDVIRKTSASGLRMTPWRMFVLEDVSEVGSSAFATAADDPALTVHACPGAPLCEQAQVETRTLARALAAKLPANSSLHVSGCAKGCAHPGKADVTLVGANGKFDLVRQGVAWEEPATRGLSAEDVVKEEFR